MNGGDQRSEQMRQIKAFCLLLAVATLAAMALIEADSAAATGLYKNTELTSDPQSAFTAIEASLEAGSSLVLLTTDEKTIIDTCTGSELGGLLSSAGGVGSHPSLNVSSLTFTGCSHKTTVIAKGSLEIKHIAGTTNGNVISKGAEVTVNSTSFGVSCIAKTEGGTSLGTLTGASAGKPAPIDVNAVVPSGFLCGGDSRLRGTYTITNPSGLVVEEEPKSGTKLHKTTAIANDPQGQGTAIEASLEAGSSFAILTTDGKTTIDTCTGSEIAAEIENAGGGSPEEEHPGGKVSGLTFSGCSEKTTVLAKGELEIRNIAGTTNGAVVSKGAEITVQGTPFGSSCVLNTESGTTVGTLTGAAPGKPAVLHINTVVSSSSLCGFDLRLMGTYTVTSPVGLVVEDHFGSKLYKETEGPNDELGASTAFEASLTAASTATLSTTDGKTLVDTCSGGKVAGEFVNAGPEGSYAGGKVSTFELSGCSHKTTVFAGGELEIKHIAGTTNGTVYSKGAEVTVLSTTFGVSCMVKTEGVIALGTLTGAETSTGHATGHINAVVPSGFLCGGDSRLKGSYTITAPTGLVVEEA